MDINLSSLHYFKWEILENTFKGELPKEQKQATFFTVSNLFYLTHQQSNDLGDWVERCRSRRQEYVLARGVLQPRWKRRCSFTVVYGLFKIPVTIETMQTSCRRSSLGTDYAVNLKENLLV